MLTVSSAGQGKSLRSGALPPYLSPLAVWALSFGCSVGWGAFVMPGTAFLPIAGPIGSMLGLLIGAAVMFVIGMNYHYLMKRFPGAGGAFTFTGKVLGSDHGFLCAWLLLLTYAAVLWANATALSLIIRFLFGDIFCFGFSYTIAGYTVYGGEVLLAVAIIVLTATVCILGRRAVSVVQILFAVLLFGGVLLCFTGVAVSGHGFSAVQPAFSNGDNHAFQVVSIAILTPWAFIGFESVSHSTGEFQFPVKKGLLMMGIALLTGALAYIMLVFCAASAVPEGFHSWQDYTAALDTLQGIQGLPTFFGVQSALGVPGVAVLGAAVFGGIVTGLVATFLAVSRLMYAMSEERMLPQWFGKTGRRHTPVHALLFIMAVSCIIPFFGRTAISWIVDVTTIGATIVYAYTSVSAFVLGRREHNKKYIATGVVGFCISFVFIVFFMLPSTVTQNRLATESYIILAIWSIIGILVFRFLMQKDKAHKIGRSEIAWLVLFFLILVISTIWIQDATADSAARLTEEIRNGYAAQAAQGGVQALEQWITQRADAFGKSVTVNILFQVGIITVSFLIIHSIFSVIRKREHQAEIEKTRAEEVSRAKSVFLSNMSHDIRTPMNAITGYTALALQDGALRPQTKEYLEKIDYSGKHLLSLINDILDMSRIESGKMELDPAPTDMIKLMDGVRDIFIMQMEAKKLHFTVDTAQVTDHYAVCDKNRLDRVLLNLISNAQKFTPENGSVTVTLRQTGKSSDGIGYQITVSDTGIGMSPAFAEHVFDAFERERSKTVNHIQGTGLGMSITKRLVELMHGSINLQTEQGKGTTFMIDLVFPEATAEEIEALQAEASMAQDSVDFTGKTVLLAEDNPINKEIAQALLEQVGFTVDYAENGQVAVDMVQAADADRYDVVLMDIQMPVMNGYDAAKAIRALDGDRAAVPVIAMSANAFAEDVQAALAAGMNAHIAKPIDVGAMMETLAKVLHK